MKLRALPYYAKSFITLIREIRNWYLIPFAPLLPGGVTITLRSGLRFSVKSLMQVWTTKEVCIDHDYQRIGATISNNTSIIDIGAGIGEFCIMAAQLAPQATIYALEPNPQTFKLLTSNITLNKADGIRPISKALVGDSNQSFDLCPGSTSAHDQVHVVAGKSSIEVLSLDQVLQLVPGRCSLLKMDCEGSEYDILLNASTETLNHIDQIVLEWHSVPGFSPKMLAEHLQKSNFSIRQIPNPVHDTIGFIYAWRS